MSTDLALGIMGVPTGSGMNAAGLMLHTASSANDPQQPVHTQQVYMACKAGEARYSSESSCFVPSQVHINIMEISLLLNFVLLSMIGIAYLCTRK